MAIFRIATGNDETGGVSTLTVGSFSSAPTAGQLLIAMISANNTFTNTSVVDNNNNQLSHAFTTDPVANVQFGIYYKLAALGTETSIKVTLAGNGKVVMTIWRVSAFDNGWSLDTTAQTTTATTMTPTTGATASIAANARVAFGGFGDDQGGSYNTPTNSGTATPTWTLTTANGAGTTALGDASASVDGLSGTVNLGCTDATGALTTTSGVAVFKATAVAAASAVLIQSRILPFATRRLLSVSRLVPVPTAGVAAGSSPSVTYAYTAN